jgi:hypothetical protein
MGQLDELEPHDDELDEQDELEQEQRVGLVGDPGRR